tara:strand:+ start:730 stop:1674 length:945 start_codon:yes stop_codon:yes gene_type:complete
MAIKVNENGVIITKDGKISCDCCDPDLPPAGSVSIFRPKSIDPCSYFIDGQSEGDYDFHTTRFQQKQFFTEKYGPDSLVNKCSGCENPSSEHEGCCVFETRTETIERKEDQNLFIPCTSTNTREVTGNCVPCEKASASTPYWSSETEGSNEVTALDELEGADFADWTSRSLPLYLLPSQGFYRNIATTTWENYYSQDYRIYQQEAYTAVKIQFLIPSKTYNWKIGIREYLEGGTSAVDPWTPTGPLQEVGGSFNTDADGKIINPGGFYSGKTDFNYSYPLPSPDGEGGDQIWTQLPTVEGRVYRQEGVSYTVTN